MGHVEDKTRGAVNEVAGKIKQAAGDLTDDEQLRDEGAADEAAGKVEEGFGNARRKVGDAIKDVGKKIGN